MATPKKAKKKTTTRTAKKKSVTPAKKKSVRKKVSAKKPAVRKKVSAKRAVPKKRVSRRSSPGEDTGIIERRRVYSRRGGQSGDLQGLSNVESADSESVDELLEEGNAYEAGIVKGIEDAPFADEEEVRTRQVPEDDVPEEYLDDDR